MEKNSSNDQEEGDSVDTMVKYLNGFIEQHAGEEDRKYVMKVFDSLAKGSGCSESSTDREVHGVGTLIQNKA